MKTEQEMRGDWNRVAGSVKEKYGEVTDDDLRQVEGNKDQLIGMIQQKTGHAREQIEGFVDSIAHYTGVASDSVRDGYQQVAERARTGYQQSSDMVSERPMESVLVAFGVGLVTGIAIGLSIASRQPEPSWRDRWRS